MLRPATPLTILLAIAFVFLLLSVISTPVVKGIPIATIQGVNFGVFGYCQPKGCSGIRIGYTTADLFGSDDDSDFALPSNSRHSLSSLLIVHPVALFMNFVALALAIAAHFHSPSHSARFLLGLLILLLPTLLVTLLAFLVDILLFVPHLQWGGWLVLASTILITASGVVTCAMRRTLVSRKARKKRIAENAEMSGENFYSRQAQESKITPPSTFDTEPKAPMVNGAPGANNLPTFTTFNPGRRSDDESRPLNSLGQTTAVSQINSREDGDGRYYGPPSRSNSRPPYNGAQDSYGNPLPQRPMDGPMEPVMRQRSQEGRRGPSPYRDNTYPPPRGQGGYGPRGRGGYPSRGYPPRGGYGPRGPPPQAYGGRGGYPGDRRGSFNGRGRGGYSAGPMIAAAGAGMMAGGMMHRGQRPPPPGYIPQGAEYMQDDEMAGSLPPQNAAAYNDRGNVGFEPPSPSNYSHPVNDQYAAYRSRSQSPGRGRASPYGSRTQSPAGGMRAASPPPEMPRLPANQAAELEAAGGRGPIVNDQGFGPAQADYVNPRANWQPAIPPTNNVQNFEQPIHIEPYQVPPAELASTPSHQRRYGPVRPRVNSGGSDVYYEDVDPRFAADSDPVPPPIQAQHHPIQPSQASSQLQPPIDSRSHHLQHDNPNVPQNQIPHANSYEDLPGARSPAESENSNFTSVSQRGVNPNWRPMPGNEFGPPAPMRRQQQQQMRRDVLLAGNPDFEIPGMAPSNRMSNRGRGGIRGGMFPGPGRPPPASGVGMGNEGRYPIGPSPVPGDQI